MLWGLDQYSKDRTSVSYLIILDYSKSKLLGQNSHI